MTTFRTSSNPFDLVKASDFSDEQIAGFWVDLAGEGRLSDLFQPLLRMPMFLLGGKGSGKTHLMRYYSAPVRKLKYEGNIYKAAIADGYLGIYVQADGLNVGRFSEKGESEEKWASIFSYYFELWLAAQFLKSLKDALINAQNEFDEVDFVARTRKLFSSDVLPSSNDGGIEWLIDELFSLRREVDHVVSNVATGRRRIDEIDVCVAPGQLVFGLPELLNQRSTLFSDVLFVYMIDEIENFTAAQQRFLNSLIRYRRGSVSIKIGARLYGVRTKKTLDGASEEIRRGAEFEQVELDAWLRDHDGGYSALALELIAKRLEQAGFGREGEIKSENVAHFFEEVDSSDYFRSITYDLVKKYDERNLDRPYFKVLKKHLSEWGGFSDRQKIDDLCDGVINQLKIDDYPLLDKVNLYLFYKRWNVSQDLVVLAKDIRGEADLFLAGGKNSAPSYYQTLDHFKSDFLAQFYRDCEKSRVVYAGIDTLIHLSQGVPRNLLGILKQIYRRSQFAGEKPFQNGSVISISTQVEGIRDASTWFWDDAQPDSHGPEVRRAMQSLAELYSGVRFSLKPAECDLGTFTIASGKGTQLGREILNHAENWSYLIRIRGGGSDRNDVHAVDDKYQLSPMLAPRWEVSEHRRGAISLSEEIFNAIFDPRYRDQLDRLVKDRLKGMQEPYKVVAKKSAGQKKLEF